MSTTIDLSKSRHDVQLDGAEVHWIKNTEWRERDRKSRVFIWGDNESILDNLTNRTRRPYEVWRVLAVKVLRELVDQNGRPLWDREGDAATRRLRWDQRAGCSCPCSPGFVVDSPSRPLRGGDFHIHLVGIPMVDETKPGRELV